MLEELKVQSTPLSIDAIKAIGQSCPHLKTFKCNVFKYIRRQSYHEKLAKMIGNTMPQLYHLELSWTKMTNAGLKAILDGCPYLETLDLCSCYLSNLQVDHLDLGEVCYTRYKMIVRYQWCLDWINGALMAWCSDSDDSSYAYDDDDEQW
ncbi:unnamed protein product [Rhodiola kirilowii]